MVFHFYKLKEKARKKFSFVFRNFLSDDPKRVSRGIAIGVFIGITPTLGIHTPLSLALSMLLDGNVLAAVLANWVCNPATALPIYYFDYKIGAFLLKGGSLKKLSNISSNMFELAKKGFDIYGRIFLGSLIFGTILAFFSYFVTFSILSLVKGKGIND